MSKVAVSASAGLFHSPLVPDILLVVTGNLLFDLHLGFMENAVTDLLAAQFGRDFFEPKIPLCLVKQ